MRDSAMEHLSRRRRIASATKIDKYFEFDFSLNPPDSELYYSYREVFLRGNSKLL